MQDPVSTNKRYIKLNKTKNKQTNLTTGYTLCDVNNEDTIKHYIVLKTSTSRICIPYLVGTIIKWCNMRKQHRLHHRKGNPKVQPMNKKIQNNQILTLYHNVWYQLEKLILH